MATLNRNQYIDLIVNIMKENQDKVRDIEDLLLDYGASEDDSDPEEGLFSTMTDSDLRNAYEELSDLLEEEKDPEGYYLELTSRNHLNVYDTGWKDGYESAKYGILIAE